MKRIKQCERSTVFEWNRCMSKLPGKEFFNPQPDPQHPMSCATYAYFGSPRVFVSCCKTYNRASVTAAF